MSGVTGHWTARYLVARTRLWFYEKRYPDRPWLTGQAVEFLSQWLKPTDVGFEWGSGRSTLWFAKRVQRLTSVEHDRRWHTIVQGQLQKQGIQNVSYHLIELENDTGSGQYIHAIDAVADAQLDFVIVDGRLRGECALAALGKLRPGGILLIDNAERYLESQSTSPEAIRGGMSDPAWQCVKPVIAPWRMLWTSNGVFDTAIFFCPSHPTAA